MLTRTNRMRSTAAAWIVAASLVSMALPVAARGQAQEKPAPKPVSIAGKWNVTLDMAMGQAQVTMEFVQDGKKVTGKYVGRYGTSPLEGTLEARALAFAVYTTIEGQESTLYFKGEVAEDGQSVKGSAELGGAGEAYWSARRAKD
jgi:hypothetical protein